LKEIWLITGNLHKVKEARRVLKEYGIELLHYPAERVEIQSDDPAKIAEYSLNQIPRDGHNHAVEDAGLFIDYYNGFPGPYSSYALEKLDNPGILNLMKDVENREAEYQSCIAFRFEGEIHFFEGVVRGKIAQSVRGTGGFGYDPIFIPEEGGGRTFGEMNDEEKNAISHRARAFRKLGEWFSKHF
jgi:XTP/dITP diphosphohydrolase